MHWYLAHTKVAQERIALQNLLNQGYECYLPTLPTERLTKGQIALVDAPLFPRYLFVRPADSEAQSIAPIRFSKGVNKLVCFGVEPAKVDARLIEQLRLHEAKLQFAPNVLFHPGDRVRLTQAPFAGIEGIYQMAEGERRVMVLIELLSKPVSLAVAPTALRKLA